MQHPVPLIRDASLITLSGIPDAAVVVTYLDEHDNAVARAIGSADSIEQHARDLLAAAQAARMQGGTARRCFARSAIMPGLTTGPATGHGDAA